MVQKNSIKKQKIVIVMGPTASGKTSIGVELAKQFNGEIISADSMQIYKHMDIGTAKVTTSEMEGIPHHLIDIVEPTNNFSVAEWVDLAKGKIDEITKRGKTPIIVGGTGLYVSSLINGYTFYNIKENKELREELRLIGETQGEEALHNILKTLSEEKAKEIDKSKIKAVIRAIEILKSAPEQGVEIKAKESPYDYLLIALNLDRAFLYERINYRVDKMVNEGLLEEFNNLTQNHNLKQDHQSAGAIGYRELFLDEPIEKKLELIKQHSRNYAKRQLTWIRKMENVEWMSPVDDREVIIEKVKKFLGESNE